MRARWLLCSVAFGVVACIAACSKKELARSRPSPAAPVAPTPVVSTPLAPTSVAVVSPPAAFQDVLDVSVFQRGNLHAHSSKSDGDRPPDAVYKWYREHGYAFLAITDHNALTLPAHRGEIEGPDFAVIAGEEITLKVRGRPVHVNGLCLKDPVVVKGPAIAKFANVGAALGWAVDSVVDHGGIALLNHPNFGHAIKAADLEGARRATLFEVWSGHARAHSDGDARGPSAEVLWETALAMGERFAAVAVDDEHHIAPDAPESVSRPGRGWVEVFAAKPTERDLCEALAKSRFYASSGVRLARIVIDGNTFSVWPKSEGARVEFIVDGGNVVETVDTDVGAPATYRLRGNERYVRAKVTAEGGHRAWTQAYFVASR